MLTGINHITLSVKDIDRSLDFYINQLGFTGCVKWNSGAYLKLVDFWLCLLQDIPSISNDCSHMAFTVSEENFMIVSKKIVQNKFSQWKVNTSEGQSLYFLDPDGHKLEIHVGTLESRLQSLKLQPYKGMEWM